MINFFLRHRHRLLVISLGIVYLWFGILKFFPGISPAESLAKETIHLLTFGLIPDNVSFILLAIWEVSIGLLLLLNVQLKAAVYLGLAHLLLTFTPLFLMPASSFHEEQLYSLTLIGQYIIKNIVLISALLTILPTDSKATIS